MGLVAGVLLAAVLAGWATGGRLDALAGVRLPAPWLVPAALAVQALGVLAGLGGAPPGPAYAVGLTVSAALVAAFLARALTRPGGAPGLGLVALGLGLNALVVAANGAMPVSASAAARAGAERTALAADLRHEPLDGGTRLPLLADVVPVALPLRPEVVSPGDVLVAAGLGQFVLTGMRRGRRRAVWQDRPPRSVAGPGRRPHPGRTHGQASPQAQEPQEEREQPRQASQRLTRPAGRAGRSDTTAPRPG